MANAQHKMSLQEMVSQLRQTGQMPSVQAQSVEQVAAKDVGKQTPRVTPGMQKSGWAPPGRERNLPKEQGKPGPDLGMAR
jgi:hypothetical protein